MKQRGSTLSRRSTLTAVAAIASIPRVFVSSATAGTARSVAEALPELDKFVETAMTRTGVPGVSIAVVHRDQAIYLKGFGVRETGAPDRVDPDTIFQLASLSKPVASTVMTALAGDEVLKWDDSIVRHDPGFAMFDPWVTSQVTLRDMFCHRSGLPDHAGDRLEDLGYDRSEVLYRLRYQKPGGGFRAHYAYTNFGLTAAAVAAAKSSGKSWEDLSAERIYRPLGMLRTSSRFADFAGAANRARTHVRAGDKWIAKYTRDADAQSPAGGVSSSARDMANWMRLQLGGGLLAGTKIIEREALAETHRPQMIRVPPPKDPAVDRAGFYGLGWNVDYDSQGRVRLSHSGAFNLGAATAVTLYPGEGLGIVVLTNAQPMGVPEAISRSFLDIVLEGRVERDWLAFFQGLFKIAMAPDYGTATDYAQAPSPVTLALPIASYAGSYANDLFGEIEIAADGSGLVLKLGPKLVAYPLRHFDRDVFTYQPTGENAYGESAVKFTMGADRKATSVTVETLDIDRQGMFFRKA